MTEKQQSNHKNGAKTRQENVRPTIGLLLAGISVGQGTPPSFLGPADAAEDGDANLIAYVGNSLRSPHGFEAQGNILYDLVTSDIIDGLVVDSGLIGHYVGSDAIQDFCEQYDDVPLVNIEIPLDGIPSVLVDFYQGMREGVNHLIEAHGYHRIAFIRGPEESPTAEERYQAYQDALADHDIPLDVNLVAPGTFFEPSGEEAVQLLLDERKVTLDAIVAANDFMAMDAMQALQKRGISVPGEVAVLGFDNELVTSVVTPPLTTARMQNYERSRQAAEMVLAKLGGEEIPNQVVLPAELVVRQSCGCPSLRVVEAGVGSVRTTDESNEALLEKQREQILSEMRQGVGSSAVKADQWMEKLLVALSAELADGSSGAFLSALTEVLKQVAAAGDNVASWQGAISVLRRHVQHSLGNYEALAQTEDLFQQARVIIGETAERARAYQNIQSERNAEVMREVGELLITTHNLTELMDTLSQQLPRLGIRSCYLSLYEDPESPAGWSRLILAYNDGERLILPEGEQRFISQQLVPEGLLPSDRRYQLVVMPLYFREGQIGFALFEFENRGQQEGLLSEVLRGQLSSALQGALLMQREEKRSRQLQTVADVSTATSTVLDTVELLQRTVDLTKESFGLYQAQIYLLDEQGQTLYLAASAGKLGQQMVAKGWNISLAAEQSLVARTARGRQGEIVNDVRSDPNWLPNPLLPDTKSELAVPLIAGARVLGVLDVQSEEINHFTCDDIRIQTTLAIQVAVALENARLFEQTSQAREEAEIAKREIEAINKTLEVQIWQTSGQAELNKKIQGQQNVETLANSIIQQLCQYLEAQVGTLYIASEQKLNLIGSYAYPNPNGNSHLQFGEGLVGQAAIEKQPIILNDLPEGYITISSSLGSATPRHVMVFPFIFNDQVVGVIELGTLTEFSQARREFLQAALNTIAIAFNTAQARARIDELLAETQSQAEELQAQGEELRVANEELAAQTESLQASETRLKEKQTELESINTQLEEKAAALEESGTVLRQKQAAIDKQNRELRTAQVELQQQAEELALASQYKSEFLANMSHELRTPLNSLLILARMLADNKDGNLTQEQVESAQIIYSGGNDLLALINDILDLSKVESGKMSFNFEPVMLSNLAQAVETDFKPMAEDKGLALKIELTEDSPAAIETDQQRLLQVIKNLMSNAIKFTSEGYVGLTFCRPDDKADLARSGLNAAQAIAIRVSDSGIGMTPEQQRIIFEAFQQADGSTSRQYGGTGLGLSISRELTMRLGGHIAVESEVGQGSVFTLYLPVAQSVSEEAEGAVEVEEAPVAESVSQKLVVSATAVANTETTQPGMPDDREELEEGDRALLIVEDDPAFAKIMVDFARKNSFKCLIAGDGRTGLDLVDRYQPDAILLDLKLPDISGWEVLDSLKHDPSTRHIPVHIISVEEEVLDAYRKGAMGYLTKPVTQEDLEASFQRIGLFVDRDIKSLLLVEDDKNARMSIKKLLGGSDVQISEADCGKQALALLETQYYDCMILDLSLPDMSGFEVLNRINGNGSGPRCPVIVYTGRDLTADENMELMKYADRVIVKGVMSPERLVDETALFLHRVVADMSEDKKQTIRQLYEEDGILRDKKVLIVDDDMRNSFALSKLLADRGIHVSIAQNGQKALEQLAAETVDLVLMDIMMPVMDGFETIERIRAQSEFSSLPILALTAKAMKGDREKCLAVGANDYLPKPVDVDRLFSMLRVWLYQ